MIIVLILCMWVAGFLLADGGESVARYAGIIAGVPLGVWMLIKVWVWAFVGSSKGVSE